MKASRYVKDTRGVIYRALRPDQIRLLSILPSRTPNEHIQCTLETVSLDAYPDSPPLSYDALSYTWGDPDDMDEISVNGQPFLATKNLKAALKLFRNTQNRIPTLWVDAICINQKDVRERSSQVQLMRKIFSEAQETWIWLGAEGSESSKAIELIRKFSDMYLQSCESGDTRRENADQTRWKSVETMGVDAELAALDSLLARPYWYRVWVVQEIAVSREIVMFCGQHTCSWNAVVFTAYILDRQIQAKTIVQNYRRDNQILDAVRLQSGIQRIMSIQSVRNDVQGTGNGDGSLHDSLLLILQNHRATEATDAKDKYIALAGLVTRDVVGVLASLPNLYHESVKVQDVYLYAALAMVVRSSVTEHYIRALDFLDCAGKPAMKELFSWVPDWSSTQGRAIPLLYWQLASERHPDHVQINAPGDSLPSEKLNCSFQPEMGSLLARGLVVDSINVVNHGQAPLINGSEHQDPVAKSQPSEYPTAENVADVVWKTLVLDRAHADGRRAPSNWGDIFYDHFTRSSCDPSHASIPQLWYEQNKHFKVCGVTIEEIAKERRDLMPNELPIDSDDDALTHFKTALLIASGCRKLATTEKGYLCLVPLNSWPRDIVAILADCSAPVMLRKHGGIYEFIGTCYVHGIMHGEAVLELGTKDPFSIEFDIR